MKDSEKIKTLGYSIMLLSKRILRLEQSEKYRDMLKDIILEVGRDVCEIDKEIV
jgi:hypothetical protein